jgi:hypothetical protein
MLVLLVLLFLVWAVLAVVLTAWSVWFQGYIYTEPAEGLVWRGPAAGAALAVAVAFWVLVDYHSVGGAEGQGRYRPLFEFSATETRKPFPELWIPKRGPGQEGDEVYKLRPGGGRIEYLQGGLPSGRPLPERPPRITVLEGEEKSVFEPERDAEGNFYQRQPPWWSLNRQPEPLRYMDQKGRVMTEDRLGVLSSFRTGAFIGNLLLNFLLLAVGFVVGWLLLRFQWPHALLQAFVLWLVLQLFVLPPILSRAEAVARERATPKSVG